MSFLIIILLFALESESFNLTVMHTGTLRGFYMPINTNDLQCKNVTHPDNTCRGGIWARAREIEKIRNSTENSVLIDTGNFYQGTVFTRYFDGNESLMFMNTIGYDMVLLGARDFDFDGPSFNYVKMKRFLEGAKFATVATNLDNSNATTLSRILKYKIITYPNGDSIGIIATLSPSINSSSRGFPPNGTISDVLLGIRAGVDILLSKGINKIILVVNDQTDRDFSTVKNIVVNVVGIDIVVVGNEVGQLTTNNPALSKFSYPYIARSPGNLPVLIVCSGRFGRYLGRLDVTFDKFGVLTNWSGDSIVLDPNQNETTYSQSVKDKFISMWHNIEQFSKTVVGRTTVSLNGSTSIVRWMECPLGNLVTDSIRTQLNVDIAVQNGGGMGGFVNEGNITVSDILNMIPFSNTIYIISITGEKIIQALQNSVLRTNDTSYPSGTGRFLQVSGLRFRYNKDGSSRLRPMKLYPILVPDRVVSADVLDSNGVFQPINIKKIYTLALNEYLVNGGNEFECFLNNTVILSNGPSLESLINSYLNEYNPANPIISGRIVSVKDPPYDFFAINRAPTPVWIYWNSSAAIVYIIIACIGIALVIASMIFVVLKRENEYIHASSYFFLLVIDIGLLLVYVSVFFWLGEPDTYVCNLRVWLPSIGYLVGYGSLLIKNMRILYYYNQKITSIVPITNFKLAAYLMFPVGIGIFILSLWVAIVPLKPTTLENSVIDPISNTYEKTCSSEGIGFLVAIIAWMGILSIAGVIISWKIKATKVPKLHNEVRFITWCTYNTILVGVTVTVLGFLLKDYMQIEFLVIVGGFFIMTIFTWGFVYIPKIRVALVENINIGDNRVNTFHSGTVITKSNIVAPKEVKLSFKRDINISETNDNVTCEEKVSNS